MLLLKKRLIQAFSSRIAAGSQGAQCGSAPEKLNSHKGR